MPAAVMALNSVTVPPGVPTKLAVLPFSQSVLVFKVEEVLQPLASILQVPLPAPTGEVLGFPVQNRSNPKAFGRKLKVRDAAMNATSMPGNRSGEWLMPW